MAYINTVEETTTDGGPKGIRGWLALMAIGMTFGPIRAFVETFKNSYSSADYIVFAAHSKAALILAYGEEFFTWLGVAITCALSYLFFTKSRHFPKAYIGFAIFSLAYLLLDTFVTSVVFNQPMTTVLGTTEAAKAFGTMFPFIPWTLYLLNSRRVANTFVE